MTWLLVLVLVCYAAAATLVAVRARVRLATLVAALGAEANMCPELHKHYGINNRCALPAFHTGPHKLRYRSEDIWWETFDEQATRARVTAELRSSLDTPAAKLVADIEEHKQRIRARIGV